MPRLAENIGNTVIETKYVLYDTNTQSFIRKNIKTVSGLSRCERLTSSYVTWFTTYEEAVEFMETIFKRLGKKYKEGDEYRSPATIGYGRKMILSARQAEAKNRMLENRRSKLNSIRVVKVTATL